MAVIMSKIINYIRSRAKLIKEFLAYLSLVARRFCVCVWLSYFLVVYIIILSLCPFADPS